MLEAAGEATATDDVEPNAVAGEDVDTPIEEVEDERMDETEGVPVPTWFRWCRRQTRWPIPWEWRSCPWRKPLQSQVHRKRLAGSSCRNLSIPLGR